jgi:uncharacterized membrane protein YfcA
MNRTFRILEIIWLMMGFVGIFMCIYSLIIKDNRGAIYFLVFFLVCGVMYYVRRRQRIKFDEAQKQKEQNK